MGIFKKLGTKLKRVVSVKNLINVGTGRFDLVAKDAVRVATTEAPAKKGDPYTPDVTFLKPTFQIPAPAMDVIEGQGKAFGAKIVTAITKESGVQNTSDFFTKVYLESMYLKYKTWIMVVVAAIVGFVLYKLTKNSKTPYRGKYRR